MIEHVQGDLLTADAEALVNAVNCVGVMGKGIALQFKQAFPECYRSYREVCDAGDLEPGVMHVFETGQATNPRYIVNFPTKRHWRGKSKLEFISLGLAELRRVVEHRGIQSIAVPPLGCGYGGLEWTEVNSLIESELGDLPDVRVLVFPPAGN